MFDQQSFFIFLGCRKRCGKDTVANMLFDHYRQKDELCSVKKVSCVQYVRNIVNDLLPELKDTDNKDKGTVNGRSYRETMVGLVDSLLKVDELCLSKNLIKECRNYVDRESSHCRDKYVFIVPDLRRSTEVEFFKSSLNNYIFVNVDRKSVITEGSYAEGSLDDYAWNYIIDNNKDLNHLEKEVNLLINIIDEQTVLI